MHDSVHVSAAQEKYMKARKREHCLIQTARAVLFLAFLSLWEISAHFSWIDSFIFSSPSRIISC